MPVTNIASATLRVDARSDALVAAMATTAHSGAGVD